MIKYCDCRGKMGLETNTNKSKCYECGVYFND